MSRPLVRNDFHQLLRDMCDPKDIYASLQPLTIISHFCGLLPFKIRGPPGQRSILITKFHFFCSIFQIIGFFICFERTVHTMRILIDSFFSNSFLRYSGYLHGIVQFSSMIIIFCENIRGRNYLIRLVDNLAKIDKNLEEIGAILNHRRVFRYCVATVLFSIFIIVWFTITEFIMSAGIQFTRTLYEIIAYKFYLTVLCFSIVKYLCFFAILLIRFRTVRQILMNLESSLAEKVKPAKRPLKSVGSRHLDAFSVFSTVQRSPKEIVEESCKIHSSLCDACAIADKYFTNQMLTIIAISFLIIVFNAYYVLEIVLGQGRKEINFETTEFVAFFTCQMVLYALCVMAIVEGSSGAIRQSEITPVLVHNLINLTKDIELREQLSIFSMQLLHRKVRFTAAGLFNLDRTLIFTIVGAATTYLVILIQFTSSSTSITGSASITSTLAPINITD